jgi:hypothetical protein
MRTCLDDAERTRLMEAFQQSEDRRLGPLLGPALATGARRGELLGLFSPKVAWREASPRSTRGLRGPPVYARVRILVLTVELSACNG